MDGFAVAGLFSNKQGQSWHVCRGSVLTRTQTFYSEKLVQHLSKTMYFYFATSFGFTLLVLHYIYVFQKHPSHESEVFGEALQKCWGK